MESEKHERSFPFLMTSKGDRSVGGSVVSIPKNYGSVDLLMPDNDVKSCCFTPNTCSALTQLWACFGKYLCMLNIGLLASLPVLLIPLATSRTFYIKLSSKDIQNLVSTIFIVMPIGSILAALPIKTARKGPIILTQAIMTASWIGTYFSTEPWHLITSRAFGGIAMTLSQPHIACYIGEVTVPGLRGVYGSLTQTMGILGQLIMSNLTYLKNWDAAVIICGLFSILSTLYLFFIPESPMLLIAYGDYKKGLHSLRKLRGWKWGNEKEIRREYQQLLKHYAQNGKSTIGNDKTVDNSIYRIDDYASGYDIDTTKSALSHVSNDFSNNPQEGNSDRMNGTNSLYDSADGSLYAATYPTQEFADFYEVCKNDINKKDHSLDQSNNLSPKSSENDRVSWCRFFLMPTMYKPLLILTVSAFFVVGPGSHTVNTYLNYILEDYHLESYYNTILTSLTSAMLAGNIASTCLVSKLGKKRIILISTIGAGTGYAALAGINFIMDESTDTRVWAVGSLLAWTIFMEEFGIRTLYHSILSELFPMRGKRIGASLIVLIICINGIVIGEGFPDFLSANGALIVMSFNVFLCFFGAIFFYFVFIETEGKTLVEIENSFKSR